jgi:hypothetical protein
MDHMKLDRSDFPPLSAQDFERDYLPLNFPDLLAEHKRQAMLPGEARDGSMKLRMNARSRRIYGGGIAVPRAEYDVKLT